MAEETDSQTPTDSPTGLPASAGSVIRPPNLVQIGDLWICEDEDQVMPDKIEFALLIQCSSAEQCRAAMKAGKIEFTIFEHYSQNAELSRGDSAPDARLQK